MIIELKKAIPFWTVVAVRTKPTVDIDCNAYTKKRAAMSAYKRFEKSGEWLAVAVFTYTMEISTTAVDGDR